MDNFALGKFYRITVFYSPKGKYKEMRDRILSNGWIVIKFMLSQLRDDWIFHCVSKDWFDTLSHEDQTRVMSGQNPFRSNV
jgi:hypothetical protein